MLIYVTGNRVNKLDKSLAALLKSFCSIRYVSLREKRRSLYKKEEIETPQGLACGPLIFILAIDEQLRYLRKRGVYIMVYADGILIIGDKGMDHVTAREEVERSMSSLNLTLNVEKSVLYVNKFWQMKIVGFKMFTLYFIQRFESGFWKGESIWNITSTIQEINWLDCQQCTHPEAASGGLYGFSL